MTKRTTINRTASNQVTLTGIDPYTDEPMERVFWCPNGGGYVREGDKQVCNGLDRRGSTLWVGDEDDLLPLIRREWQVCRREAARLCA